MKAWIARDRYRTFVTPHEPQWSSVGGVDSWTGTAIRAWIYEGFQREFPGIELEMNTKQPITLTAAPLGPAVQGGE